MLWHWRPRFGLSEGEAGPGPFGVSGRDRLPDSTRTRYYPGMRTFTAALAAAAAAATLTACGAQTVAAPTAADLSYTASQKLQASTAQCQTDAAARFPGFANAPARELAQAGCERATCDSLATFANNVPLYGAEPRFAEPAGQFLTDRWNASGCLEVQARAEAAG